MLLLAVTSIACASSVNMQEPYNTTIYNNGSVYIGKVGPGQSFYITISAVTTNASGTVFERGWNELLVTGAPPGWLGVNSSLYNSYSSVKITPPASASNGTYQLNLSAVNIGNYSKLGSVKFKAFVNVTPNVFVLQVTPTNVTTGPGQPASVYVTINNTGVSDSPFYIQAQGLPAWNLSKEVIAPHGTQEVFSYPIFENEPGVYSAKFNVTSAASPLVFKRSAVTLTVQASVLGDYKALGQGAVGFPIIYEPAYALMNLIGKLLGRLGI